MTPRSAAFLAFAFGFLAGHATSPRAPDPEPVRLIADVPPPARTTCYTDEEWKAYTAFVYDAALGACGKAPKATPGRHVVGAAPPVATTSCWDGPGDGINCVTKGDE